MFYTCALIDALIDKYDGSHMFHERVEFWDTASGAAHVYAMSKYHMKEDLTTKYDLPQTQDEYEKDGVFLTEEW